MLRSTAPRSRQTVQTVLPTRAIGPETAQTAPQPNARLRVRARHVEICWHRSVIDGATGLVEREGDARATAAGGDAPAAGPASGRPAGRGARARTGPAAAVQGGGRGAGRAGGPDAAGAGSARGRGPGARADLRLRDRAPAQQPGRAQPGPGQGRAAPGAGAGATRVSAPGALL